MELSDATEKSSSDTTGVLSRDLPTSSVVPCYKYLQQKHNGEIIVILASVKWNQHDALFIQFIENRGPVHVSSISCSSSGGASQTAFRFTGSFTATVPQLTLYARNIRNSVCVAPPEDEQVILETCRGPWFSINWMKSASRWFHYTDILWCTASKILS
jgi:hypothetical protein